MTAKDYLKTSLIHMLAPKKESKKLCNDLDNDNNVVLTLPKTRAEIVECLTKRIIAGSYNDYKNLIHNHLLMLQQFFYFDKKEEKIKIYAQGKKFIESIVAQKSALIDTFIKNEYISFDLFIKIINYEDTIMVNNEETFLIYKKNYGNREKIIKILELFIIKENPKLMRKKVDSFINSSEHLLGLCDGPTFFEFISSLGFLIKHNPNIYEVTPAEFVSIIKQSLNLIFSEKKLVPIRFAPGGRPDAVIKTKDGDIIVEPTLQLNRQTSMELDSFKIHINNHKGHLNKAFIIAPEIEKDLKVALRAWVQNGIINFEALAINIKEVISYLQS